MIADSAIRIIARDGVRALTHRAVDQEAGLPQGSTSHLARTRSALIELVVDALATRTLADSEAMTDALPTPSESDFDIDGLAALLSSLIESLAERGDDMRARYALILELHDAPDLRAKLTSGSEVHLTAQRIITAALTRAHLPHSDDRVDELLALADSLVFHRTAIDGSTAVEPVLAAYLRGITTGRA